MNRGDIKLREVTAAIKRLKASDTPRKRANALKAFAKAMKGLKASGAGAFPKLRADGSRIIKRKVKGARCPICKVPMRSFKMLAEHLLVRHNIGVTCVCDYKISRTIGGRNIRTFVRHLAGVPDLRVHFAEAAMKRAAGLL